MAKTIEEWIEKDVKKIQRKSGVYLAENFCRDPLRPTIVDNSKFFSPADGILVFQKEVEATEPIVEVKGKFFTPQCLLDDFEYTNRSLIISVYMTSYSVHYNRMPTSGFITYGTLECLKTNNLPMLYFEKKILQNIVDFNECEYLFYNERRVSTIYVPKMNYTYYIVQTADLDVNCITHFVEQEDFVNQTNKFSLIHFGSQCTMILPLPAPFKYKLLLPDLTVVEAGVDALIQTDFQTYKNSFN